MFVIGVGGFVFNIIVYYYYYYCYYYLNVFLIFVCVLFLK